MINKIDKEAIIRLLKNYTCDRCMYIDVKSKGSIYEVMGPDIKGYWSFIVDKEYVECAARQKVIPKIFTCEHDKERFN